MKQKRNMSISDVSRLNMPDAVWNDWTIRNAVKNGYVASGWVYRAVSIISKNGASVPWIVLDKNNKKQQNHPIAKLLNAPNPKLSRQDFFELILSWQQLAGTAYAKKIFVGGSTRELWPISPDRIAPKQSAGNDKLIDGYHVLNKNGIKRESVEFTDANVVAFKLLNPANPIEGVGPLQAVAKTVDIDVEQQTWNKSAMQNRGVLDGIFSFDKPIDRDTFDTIRQQLKEMFSFGSTRKAREPGVIGSNAKYQQLSLSPVEMDFLNSRKFNREEIFTIFGIPVQLAGSQESSTFNNFAVAMRILWVMTILPALDDLADTLNMSFREELDGGKFIIAYDTSMVGALREQEDEKAATAKIYFDMGVPMENLNEKFKLNMKEFTGWDLPWGGHPPRGTTTLAGADSSGANRAEDFESNVEKRDYKLKTWQQRDIALEIQRKEDLAAAEGKSIILKALSAQRDRVFESLDEDANIEAAIVSSKDNMVLALSTLFTLSAESFADTVVIDKRSNAATPENRAISQNMQLAIDEFINNEGIILTELALIDAVTTENILDIMRDGSTEGKSVENIKQAIIDSGTFSPERALRIARTSVGTGQSIGQIVAAGEAGAISKTWRDSDLGVRIEHSNRDGETVGLNERFSSQFPGFPAPRWPLDQNIAPADRVNCRCSMSFS